MATQTEDKYIVRFPDGMRDRLKAEAAKANRTLNAEIVARLEASFAASEGKGVDDVLKAIETLHAEMLRLKKGK